MQRFIPYSVEKPLVRWLLSQKGFRAEPPQRQKAATSLRQQGLPLESYSVNTPKTRSGPLVSARISRLPADGEGASIGIKDCTSPESENSQVMWLLSQNGLFWEEPQRQSARRVSSNARPRSGTVTCSLPRRYSGPFSWTEIVLCRSASSAVPPSLRS